MLFEGLRMLIPILEAIRDSIIKSILELELDGLQLDFRSLITQDIIVVEHRGAASRHIIK